jgi:thiol-disulfide isomerase/thioredoxin
MAWTTSVLGLLVLNGSISGTTQPDVDPDKALQEVNRLLAGAWSKDPKNPEMNVFDPSKAIAKAKEFVMGVDPKAVEPSKALTWAQLFSHAQQHSFALTAAKTFIAFTQDPSLKQQALVLALESGVKSESAVDVLELSKHLEPKDPKTIQKLSYLIPLTAASFIFEVEGAAKAADLISTVDSKIDWKNHPTPQERDAARMIFARELASYYHLDGRTSESTKALSSAQAEMDPESASAKTLAAQREAYTFVGSSAPSLQALARIGDISNLESLRGKVVMLDFYAHWCGPCIVDFPNVKQLLEKYRDRGLEVVGVTAYWGYYGREKELSKETEFEKLKAFAQEYALPWPTMVVPQRDFNTYGAFSIPHTALIGRDGKLVRLASGGSKSKAHLERVIQRLLSES